jgi:hypothetical protein
MEVSSRNRNVLLTTVGVLVALVVVAIASRGSTSAGDATTRRPHDALLDAFVTLYILAMLAGAGVLVYVLLIQRRLKAEAGHGKRRTLLELLLTFAVLAGGAIFLARRAKPFQPPLVEDDVIPPPQGTPINTSGAATTPYDPGIDWIPVLVTVALVVLAVGTWWFAGRARKRERGELRVGLADALAQAVDESLDDLRAEPDPRRAVIAAYARLERVVSAHGLPRKPSDAPLEYLSRMLDDLSVSPEAAQRLTNLFEMARFSQHAVGGEMKLEAISALERVRDDLLAARALAEQERDATLAAQRERAVT